MTPKVTPTEEPEGKGHGSRRSVLIGGLTAGAALGAGGLVAGQNLLSTGDTAGDNQRGNSANSSTPEEKPAGSMGSGDDGHTRPHTATVPPYGEHQPGIAVPHPRQRHLRIIAHDIDSATDLPRLLDDLGDGIVSLVESGISGLAPSSLTITVGIGPKAVRNAKGDVSGAEELPDFSRDNIDDQHRDGDLMLQICADDPAVISLAGAQLTSRAGNRMKLRWRADGFRGQLDQGIGRNLLGFHDGVSVPTTPAEMEDDVWLDSASDMPGGTIAVMRVMPIDIAAFSRLDIADQEAAIGRERDTGAPLSGGTLHDDPDLHAKTPSGEFAIDNSAHVRRAHPLPAGADGLMLRRSYSYDNGPRDRGLIFISFQKSLDTFVRTQHRLDEDDALMEFTSTTASGTFLILPGFTAESPLGNHLR